MRGKKSSEKLCIPFFDVSMTDGLIENIILRK